jgi:hypothetical protein
MPARNLEAVRQRAIDAARQRSGQPVTPPLDPVFVALNPNVLPGRPRPPAELYQWVRRDEEYATLGANVVVELNSESRARQSTTRAWAIIRRAERADHHTSDRQGRGERRQADRATRSDRTTRSHQPKERGMCPASPDLARQHVADLRRARSAETASAARLTESGPWAPLSRWCLIQSGPRRRIGQHKPDGPSSVPALEALCRWPRQLNSQDPGKGNPLGTWMSLIRRGGRRDPLFCRWCSGV